ncbi:Aste57867_8729 [Aphanomyces stellatus]|uniref:Aste57867_8729 protein n=1 Tax=Aphanomyces stellatus TaxID=120398 RepID=A0A485KL02_9STRA|nr:hypothetical protein As57867_008695 [Aphanomyces stellatus]VFT85615.1 Aste57867_8729 [Aphanomyces stellatus]
MLSIKSLALLALAVAAYEPWNGDAESICGADQAKPAACIKDAEPAKYQIGRAVGRLPGIGCTGWLWGSQGHFITNNHCIGSAAQAKKTPIELGSECTRCSDKANQVARGCPGVRVANSTTLVYTSKELDFTLVTLDLNPGVSLEAFGYLQARAAPAEVDDQVYVVGHPRVKPKHFALVNDDGQPAKITDASTASKCAESDTYGYNTDTEGGSSGSPVIGVADNKVVALHNCGGCSASGGQNTGNKMHKIVDLLTSLDLLPQDAVAGTPDDNDETR